MRMSSTRRVQEKERDDVNHVTQNPIKNTTRKTKMWFLKDREQGMQSMEGAEVQKFRSVQQKEKAFNSCWESC